MVGLDSGDLLVMGGSSPFVYFRSTAIYRLSSNVWTYVAEFQKPMARLADPVMSLSMQMKTLFHKK
jgi:alkylated DNA repair dioxygenase AlkB